SSDFPSASACTSAPIYRKAAAAGAVTAQNGGAPSAEDLKQAIYTYGAVLVNVDATGFDSYSGGVLCTPGATTADHQVALIGWNDADGYWIVRNSWGATW